MDSVLSPDIVRWMIYPYLDIYDLYKLSSDPIAFKLYRDSWERLEDNYNDADIEWLMSIAVFTQDLGFLEDVVGFFGMEELICYAVDEHREDIALLLYRSYPREYIEHINKRGDPIETLLLTKIDNIKQIFESKILEATDQQIIQLLDMYVEDQRYITRLFIQSDKQRISNWDILMFMLDANYQQMQIDRIFRRFSPELTSRMLYILQQL